MDGALADELDHVSRKLERNIMSFDTKSPPPGFYDAQIRNHRILSEEHDEVVRRIRKIDGFTNFLRAVPFASLQSAAIAGPVILVNITPFRSDAIILRGFDPPVLVHLPKASPDALQKLSNDISSALALDHKAWAKMGPILRDLWMNSLRWELRRNQGFGGVRLFNSPLCRFTLQVHTDPAKRIFPTSTFLHIHPRCRR
jgi:hypothetical protein